MRAFLAFIATGLLILLIVAFLQYRRRDWVEAFHFNLSQIELTRMLAWGVLTMIGMGLVLHYCFMWPIRSREYAIALGLSLTLGILIPYARDFLSKWDE